MYQHKADCKFKGFHKSVTAFDPNGPDNRLCVTETFIEFENNIHNSGAKDFTIEFSFCPVCGVKYEG